MKTIETIITIKFPLKRRPKYPANIKSFLPFLKRILIDIFAWGGGSVTDLSGRTNTRRHFSVLRFHIFTIEWNQYHDESDKERADRYMKEIVKMERELRGLRLLQMGDECTNPELRKLLKSAFGVDLDEGRLL